MTLHKLQERAKSICRHTDNGFTLIEVMIVVAIVAILAAVAFPSYQEQVRKSRRGEAKAALLKTMQAQEKYYTQFNRYFAFDTSTSLGQTPFRAFSGETAEASSHAITATACGSGPGENIDACVRLTAIPGEAVGGMAFADAKCGHVTLSSTGFKAASGPDGMKCWQ